MTLLLEARARHYMREKSLVGVIQTGKRLGRDKRPHCRSLLYSMQHVRSLPSRNRDWMPRSRDDPLLSSRDLFLSLKPCIENS